MISSAAGFVGENNSLHLKKAFREANGEVVHQLIPIQSILSKIDRHGWKREYADDNITQRDIRSAMTIASLKMPGRPEYERNNRYKRTKILLDENMSARLIPELSTALSNISHVYFDGMQGNTDEFIYWRPHAQLKDRTIREQRVHNETKYIIITQDSDLSDISRAQWMSRVMACSTPEDIDFTGLNAIIHVRDNTLGKPENASIYLPLAKDILRAAYSQEASSYVLTRGGVYPEIGCSLNEIINEAEAKTQIDRVRNNEMTAEDVAFFDRLREEREKKRLPTPRSLSVA